jgi:3-oxoacyl-[acyl-carrier protein] reductase
VRPQIHVNAINPGIVETEGTHTAGFISAEFFCNAQRKSHLGSLVSPATFLVLQSFWPAMTHAGI